MTCVVDLLNAPTPQVIVDGENVEVVVPGADPVVIEVGVPGPAGAPGPPGPSTEISAEAITAGDAVSLDTNGFVQRAQSSFSSNRWRFYGIAASTVASAGQSVSVWVVHGSQVPQARFDVPPNVTDNGKHVWLTSSPGVLSLSPPIGADQVRFLTAILQGADGVNPTPPVRLFPQYISRTP